MLEKIKAIFADGFSAAAVVEAITLVVKEILAYIAGEEGYDYPAAE